MIDEKRQREPAVPDNVEVLLTGPQRVALHRVENFGWQLKFVRRPRFESPVVVVENSTGANIGTLEENGDINLNPRVQLRH